MSLRFPAIAMAILAGALSTPALASSDGTLGPTSTGSINVNATISPATADNVQVYDLDDFSFNGTEGSPIVSQTQSFCLIRQNSGLVGLTISSSSGMDMDFRVKDLMAMASLGLTLTVTVNGGQQAVLSHGVAQTFTAPATCNPMGMEFSSLQIAVPDAATASTGNYSNSFVVNVAPQ